MHALGCCTGAPDGHPFYGHAVDCPDCKIKPVVDAVQPRWANGDYVITRRSIWRHADGDLYQVVRNGEMKDDATGAWVPAVSYQPFDSNPRDAFYTTSHVRWRERFTFVASQ